MPQGRKAVLLHVLRYSLLYNAVFWGMAGGVLVSALGLGLWGPLDRAAELVGHTAAPCMLVTLGLTLRERLAVVLRHAGGHALLRQTALQVCKLVVQPLVCWGILAALGVEGLWLAVSVIMAASGSALVVPVLADVHHAGPEEATLTALVSNGLSLFSLSFFIWLMRLLGHI